MQKTAYDMRISDWSSDLCASDLIAIGLPAIETSEEVLERVVGRLFAAVIGAARAGDRLTYGVGSGEGDSVRIFLSRPAALAGRDAEALYDPASRSEEHTSELQSLMRISYAVFCLKKKKTTINHKHYNTPM